MAPLANLPKCVISLLQQMMEKDRNNRFQTPQDLQKAILACLEEIRAAPGRSAGKAAEPTGAFETLDLTSSVGQPLTAGLVLAHNYKLIAELAESPQGRRFLADDLRRNRRVSLLILSREFLSDAYRLNRVEAAVQLMRAAPPPMLRELFSLDIVTDRSFWWRSISPGHLAGVLGARSVLSAAEVVRLLSLLAPLADHATGHRLQHVDFTLLGIHLRDRTPTRSGMQPDFLQRPLTAWEPLEPKVDAIDLSFLPPDADSWSGSATRIQSATGSGPRGSSVRLLSLLAYELLGGPRARVESTGQYTPIAALSQEGNAVLRRALVDEYPSAAELVEHLATAVTLKRPSASVSASATPFTPEPISQAPPPKAAVPIERKFRIGMWGWILALGLIASLGIVVSYVIIRLLHPPAVLQVVF
jgi:hypothetical protein